jgi:hypothetical protein
MHVAANGKPALSRRTIALGLVLFLSVALSAYLLFDRAPRQQGGRAWSAHDYIAASARIDTGMPYRDVVALIGKPRSNMGTADAGGADPTTLTPAELRAARLRYTEWDIGKEGEGDFWTRIFPRDDPQDQYLTVIFDRDDRVQSKSIWTVRDVIYQD